MPSWTTVKKSSCLILASLSDVDLHSACLLLKIPSRQVAHILSCALFQAGFCVQLPYLAHTKVESWPSPKGESLQGCQSPVDLRSCSDAPAS